MSWLTLEVLMLLKELEITSYLGLGEKKHPEAVGVRHSSGIPTHG